MSHIRSFLVSFALLILFGCGGGSDGGSSVGGGDGALPSILPPVETTTIRLQSVLERSVPTSVTHLRLTGFDSTGQVRYGPQTKPKAPLIDFEFVPISVTRIQVEYLNGDRVLGVGLREVVLIAGQVALFADLDFTDIDTRLVSLAIEPGSLTLSRGTSGQLRAVGHYDDGTVLDLTGSVRWATSNSQATVEPNGRVKGESAGSTTVSATMGGSSASAVVTITSTSLTSLRFEPAVVSLPVGFGQTFLVSGVFSDGSVQDLTNDVSLSVADTAVATLTSPTGSVLARSAGHTQVRASFLGVSSQAALTVTSATLSRLDVTPQNATLPRGTTQQFLATGVFSDQTTLDVSDLVIWRSDRPSVLGTSPTGLATALSAGSATVSANYQNRTGRASVTVSPATLTGLTVTPSTATLPKGLSLQLTVTASYSDGASRDVTSAATYRSNSSSVSVSSLEGRGLVRAEQVGSGNITAAFGGREATAMLTVSREVLQSLTVSPAQHSLPVGLSKLFKANGRFSDGTGRDLTDQVSWNSLQPQIAGIDQTGLALGLSEGQTTIRASLNGVSGDGTLTVTEAELSGVVIKPSEVVLSLQQSRSLTAYAVYTNGDEIALASGVSWTSQAPTVVEVEASGRVTGRLQGQTSVTAAFSGFSTTTAVTVAQRTFGDFITRREYQGFTGQSGSIKLEDFNEDGHLDAMVTSGYGLGFSAGDGRGGFLPPVAVISSLSLDEITTGDYNGDGHLDAVAGQPLHGDPVLLLGDGAGGFSTSPVGPMGGSSSSLTSADFNGDGRPDIASVSPQASGVSVRFASAGGPFGPLLTLDLPNSPYGSGYRVLSGDVDGNGLADIVVSTDNLELYLFLSMGDEQFARTTLATGLTSLNGLDLADVNGDGKLDLAHPGPSTSLVVRLGNGDGTFSTPVTTTTEYNPAGLTLADVDGDGVLDVLALSSRPLANPLVWVKKGLGDGTFGALTEIDFTWTLSFDVGDMDGDGLADLVTKHSNTGMLSVNSHRQTGELKTVKYSPVQFNTSHLAAADFNEDGILDVAFSERFFLGDGAGLFTPVARPGYLGFSGYDVVAGDLDGDGHADLVATTGSGIEITYGAGDGTVDAYRGLSSEDYPFNIVMGDFNGDGRTDLMFNTGRFRASVRLAVGDREFGVAMPVALPYMDSASNREMVVGDLNGDGVLDLVVTADRSIGVLAGIGNGQFQEAVVYPVQSSKSIALADVDADGDLDILSCGSPAIVVHRNDGDGTFSATVETPSLPGGEELSVKDMDLDGHLDVVVRVAPYAVAAVHYGNGDGTFAPAVLWGIGDNRGTLLVEDFNGDGAPDLASCGDSVSVVLNAAFPASP